MRLREMQMDGRLRVTPFQGEPPHALAVEGDTVLMKYVHRFPFRALRFEQWFQISTYPKNTSIPQ
jgi:hypothetical protein